MNAVVEGLCEAINLTLGQVIHWYNTNRVGTAIDRAVAHSRTLIVPRGFRVRASVIRAFDFTELDIVSNSNAPCFSSLVANQSFNASNTLEIGAATVIE